MKKILLTLMVMMMAPVLNASIEFVGYITSGKTITFALVDTADGRAKFVDLGANFAGYSVVEYTKQTETLTLKKEEETLAVKIRSATFTIPAEVTGAEREEQFFRKMREMLSKPGLQKKVYFIEDYMATAAQFGREIVSYDVQDGVEIIVMALPKDLSPPPVIDGRVVYQAKFMTHTLCRDKKTRVTLLIR